MKKINHEFMKEKNIEIGKKIKARRKELGMTQEELALKLGYKHKSSEIIDKTGKIVADPDGFQIFLDGVVVHSGRVTSQFGNKVIRSQVQLVTKLTM